MPVRVGINGFGRIGRNVLRAGLAKETDVEWVAVNDITDNSTLAHLLKYDSILGPYQGEVEVRGDSLIVDGAEIKVFEERDPAQLPWSDLGVEVVLESTGFFTKRDDVLVEVVHRDVENASGYGDADPTASVASDGAGAGEPAAPVQAPAESPSPEPEADRRTG